MSLFKFKHFSVDQTGCAMKIGTDSLVFGAWMNPDFIPKRILDIGTGTGVLSLMMAQKFPEAEIISLEIDAQAVLTAKLNLQHNELGKNCTALHQDFLTYEDARSFDLIISNPPYFENSTKSGQKNRDLARHTDYLPISELFQKSKSLLSENGCLGLILPQETMAKCLTENVDLNLIKRLDVYGKEGQHNRTCALFSKVKTDLEVTKLLVRNADGSYTNEYKKLTVDFHGVVL